MMPAHYGGALTHGGKGPPLFFRIPNIFAVNYRRHGGNPQPFINFFQVVSKAKILINSWHFFMVLLDVPSAAIRLTTSVFRK